MTSNDNYRRLADAEQLRGESLARGLESGRRGEPHLLMRFRALTMFALARLSSVFTIFRCVHLRPHAALPL
jgi:hypothetical protein